MSKENDTPEKLPGLKVLGLVEFFRYPVYIWPLAKKRAFLFLGALARWNAKSGPLFQDQLIHMCGLDIGPSTGPNNLRALKIAIRQHTGIGFEAQGNAINRVYTFEDESQKEAVLLLLDKDSWSKIYDYLLNELNYHRRRDW